MPGGAAAGTVVSVGSGLPNGRQLYGRHGYGRFRVLALGSTARWTTVSQDPDGRRFQASVDSSDGASAFEAEDLVESEEESGTTVRVTGEAERKTRLLNDKVRSELTARFAMYLDRYRETVISWRGIPLDASEAVERQDTYPLFLPGAWEQNGEPPTLRVVEWKHNTVVRVELGR